MRKITILVSDENERAVTDVILEHMNYIKEENKISFMSVKQTKVPDYNNKEEIQMPRFMLARGIAYGSK